ncbi:MAG: hypothetical protein ABSC77_10940 [Terracidiphilus sp.]|jgi:hypothetical protein
MEELGEREISNVELVANLLHNSFEDANVSCCKCRLGGKKFIVEVKSMKMFLCVSHEYLSDQNKARISKDFEIQNVAGTLIANPKQYFLLGNNGFQQIADQDAAS